MVSIGLIGQIVSSCQLGQRWDAISGVITSGVQSGSIRPFLKVSFSGHFPLNYIISSSSHFYIFTLEHRSGRTENMFFETAFWLFMIDRNPNIVLHVLFVRIHPIRELPRSCR
jgi:hypothetical protein